MNKLDKEGYPTDEFLEWLSKHKDVYEILDAVEETWMFGDWGFVKSIPRGGKFTIRLHTGGWSGNESIIDALHRNFYFWYYWKEHRVGGHYKFVFNVKER